MQEKLLKILLFYKRIRWKLLDGNLLWGVLFLIIQIAKANGLCIEMYLEHALSNINKINIDDILPWSEKLPKELKLNLK